MRTGAGASSAAPVMEEDARWASQQWTNEACTRVKKKPTMIGCTIVTRCGRIMMIIIIVKRAIYCPRGRGTLRQQLTILHVLHILHILHILHYIALPWTILHYLAPSCTILHHLTLSCTMLHHVAPCCTMLHHVAPCCTMLHHVAPWCTILQH